MDTQTSYCGVSLSLILQHVQLGLLTLPGKTLPLAVSSNLFCVIVLCTGAFFGAVTGGERSCAHASAVTNENVGSERAFGHLLCQSSLDAVVTCPRYELLHTMTHLCYINIKYRIRTSSSICEAVPFPRWCPSGIRQWKNWVFGRWHRTELRHLLFYKLEKTRCEAFGYISILSGLQKE